MGVRESGEPRDDPRRQDADALGRHGLVNSSEELRGTCLRSGVGRSAEQTPQPDHGPGRRGVVTGDISYQAVAVSPAEIEHAAADAPDVGPGPVALLLRVPDAAR